MNNLPFETLVELEDLLEQWRNLIADAVAKKFFNYELFKDTFIKTYRAVHHLSHQQMVHKQHIELFSFAKEFEATRFININEEHSAACHLTHELFQDCFVLYYKESETPVITDFSGKDHSYEDVDALIYLIKNHL